jgi:hypothetical protein
MIDKEYLKKLKEEDYMAWDDLVNDPMVVGSDDGVSSIVIIIGFILVLSFAISLGILI